MSEKENFKSFRNTEVTPTVSQACVPEAASNSSQSRLLSEKHVKAISRGEYVDFSEIHHSLHQQIGSHNDSITLRSSNGNIDFTMPWHHNVIENFDDWLLVWYKYERQVVRLFPELYDHLAQYRETIQLANRKFTWQTV